MSIAYRFTENYKFMKNIIIFLNICIETVIGFLAIIG